MVNPRALRFLTFDEVRRLPTPEWLIDGLVPSAGLSVLYGAPKTGKSFVALDWALCVATGLPWLGREVRQCPVVYVAAEGVAGLGVRAEAWCEARRHDGDIPDMRFLGRAVNLRDAAIVTSFRSLLADLPRLPRLLVIDTMARTMPGGDENSSRDVGEFIAATDALRGQHSAIVVHHSGKTGRSERGSSVVRGSADAMIRVERDGLSPRLKLSCEAMKDAAEWTDIRLALQPVADSRVVVQAVEGRQGSCADDDLRGRVLAYISRHGPCSKNQTSTGVTGRRDAVLAAVTALKAAGQVSRTDEGYVVVPRAAEPSGNPLSGGDPRTSPGREGPPVGGPPQEPPGPLSAVLGPYDSEPAT